MLTRAEAYIERVSYFKSAEWAKLTSAVPGKEVADEFLKGVARRAEQMCPSPLTTLQYLDFQLYLPHDQLTFLDLSSMAHSLEARVPFLDSHLIEQMTGLPTAYKIQGNTGKVILRKAMKEELGERITSLPKRGFTAPVETFLSKKSLLLKLREDLGHLDGLIDAHLPLQLLSSFEAGMPNAANRLWCLLNFSAWYEEWLS